MIVITIEKLRDVVFLEIEYWVSPESKRVIPKNIIKILRIFRIVGHPRDPKGEDHGYLSTFRGVNAPKSGPFLSTKTMSKHFLNNSKTTFKKSRNLLF